MSKRPLSLAILPEAKRVHGVAPHHIDLAYSPFTALYDEIILVIFSYLAYTDLCTAQHVSRDWSRLALDNQVLRTLTDASVGALAELHVPG